MLDQLDNVPWHSLTHAYGEASDVPGQIRALTSSVEQRREEALSQLYGNVFHQGTRWEASPFVVPFLYELIADDLTPEKEKIIYLLVHLALGYPEYYLPSGVDARPLGEEFNESEGYVDAKCYHAVREGTPELLELLYHGDSDVRRASFYALAWFPAEAAKSIPAIETLLSIDRNLYNTATAVLSLGLLGRSYEVSFDEGNIRSLLSADSLLLRTSAAIALAQNDIDDHLIEVLVQALTSAEELNAAAADIPFNDGDLVGYAGMSLAKYGSAARDKVISALCLALRSARPLRTLDLTSALLDVVVSGRDGPINKVSTRSLDKFEKEALLTIVNHGAWEIAGGVFANYCSLVRNYGLPDTPEGLRKLIDARSE